MDGVDATTQAPARALGAALALVFLLAAIIGALVFVVGSVGHEWRELAIKAQDGFQRLVVWSQTLPFAPEQRQLNDVTEQISGFVSSAEFGSGALGGIGAVTEVSASLGMMAIILFFLLKDGPQMWEFLVRPFEGIAFDRAERIRRKTVDVFGGYISSTAAAALFDAVGILIGLLILQVPLAVPLAILTFLLAFIPIIGAVSAGAVAALVALVSNGPLTAALVVLVVVIINQVEGNVLKPILMGKTVSLHALVVLIVIAAGTAVGGITGALSPSRSLPQLGASCRCGTATTSPHDGHARRRASGQHSVRATRGDPAKAPTHMRPPAW